MTKIIRLLVVDDHAVVRQGISAWIDSEVDLQLIGEACDGIEAVEKALALNPDVILMDLMMPKKDGIEAITDILREDPDAHILVITSFSEQIRAIPAINAGALGFIVKDTSPEEMLQAIRQVSQGNPWLSHEITRMLMRNRASKKPSTSLEDPLTKREIEVLKLIARGFSDVDIANELVISTTTVRFHISNILAKLHLKNRTQVALYAIKEGYVSI
jgi:NarL family two-component system response regulator LiaR